MKILIWIAAFIFVYSLDLPAQILTAGVGDSPKGKYISYFADTKKPRIGKRMVFGLTCDGRYFWEFKKWRTKTGLNMGTNKLLITPWICRENRKYYWEITIGFYQNVGY